MLPALAGEFFATSATDEDVEKGEPLCAVGGRVLAQSQRKTVRKCTRNETELLHDMTYCFQVYIQRKQNHYLEKISVLHTHCHVISIGKMWKQSMCPSTNEWIKKMRLREMLIRKGDISQPSERKEIDHSHPQ